MDNIEFKFFDGLVGYPAAVEAMEAKVAEIIDGTAREAVWFLQHPPTYTAGTSAKASDLLNNMGFEVYQTGRGGQYTYHGPGQLIVYLMLDLKTRFNSDLRAYVKWLEQIVIDLLKEYGIKGERREGRVGIWVVSGAAEKKIAAIGVRVRKGISFHGISININPDLSHYNGIVPCGISEYGVTSISEIIGELRPDFENQMCESIQKYIIKTI